MHVQIRHIFMATKKNILVAEDEKPMARALKLKLEGVGYQVTAVHDGQAALDELSGGTYDLVLLDLMMPKLDGFGVLEGMKEKKIKTPAVVSTNLSQPEDERKVRELGAVDFFVKSDTPITKVVEHIQHALDA